MDRSELAHVSVSERSVRQWPSPPGLALALAISQQGGGPEGPRSAHLVGPQGSSITSSLTPCPELSHVTAAGCEGRLAEAGREAPSTQLKLLPSKKGRMKTGHTGGRCGPRPPVCAAPGPGTSAHSSAGRWGETSEDAVVRPARQAWSCDPATRGAKGAPCPKGAHGLCWRQAEPRHESSRN